MNGNFSEQEIKDISRDQAKRETGCAMFVLMGVFVASVWFGCHCFKKLDERIKALEQIQQSK